ncbi:hypothetical protein Plhal304r1_c002g0007831 [Plasmopara halstedii]
MMARQLFLLVEPSSLTLIAIVSDSGSEYPPLHLHTIWSTAMISMHQTSDKRTRLTAVAFDAMAAL